MSRRVVILAAIATVALVAAVSTVPARAGGPTPQDLTVTVSDGTTLACELVVPAGDPPAGGWPGLLLFPGFGLPPAKWQGAETSFAEGGFVSLSCEPRGTGASGGEFDLAGAIDVRDVRDLFDWITARPDVSDTEIGAFGLWDGGGIVWNAAVAGVPFKAIVPALTWTSLGRALAPNGVVKQNLYRLFTVVSPRSSWDSTLTAAARDLSRGRATDAVKEALDERSPLRRLHSLTVPTLMIQSRHDLNFDLGQATMAYTRLAGPKRLYVGSPEQALPEALAWFQQYLVAGPPVGGGVELAHAPPDGTTTTFPGLPPTRSVSVNLVGKGRRRAGVLRRSVRLPGGPLETFGAGSVTVRYSGAARGWRQLVATVLVKGNGSPVTEGAAPITASSGVVKIPLLDTAVLLRRGKRLVVVLSPRTGVFNEPAPPSSQRAITIQRATLRLSVLRLAVSR